MKPMTTRTPDVNATGSKTNGADVSLNLSQVTNQVHTTPEQCLMSITTIVRQAQGIRAGEVISKLAEDAYFMRVDNRVTQAPPLRTHEPGTRKLLVAVQRMVDATTPEENNHITPTVLGHQLENLLRAATVMAALEEAAVALVTSTAVAEAAAVRAHHTVLAGELVAVVIAGVEAMQTATSSASHTAAMMPAAELKKYVARRPSRQVTATVSPPSSLDFATRFSQRNSNL
jgi:hypothetical protein